LAATQDLLPSTTLTLPHHLAYFCSVVDQQPYQKQVKMQRLLFALAFLAVPTESFVDACRNRPPTTAFVSSLKVTSRIGQSSSSTSISSQIDESSSSHNEPSARRSFLTTSAVIATTAAFGSSGMLLPPPFVPKAYALGPVKLNLIPTKISAAPCPPSKPIPGEKAMKGMRGICVTVQADLEDLAPKELIKVGVYGFVVDGETGDSVLANNPDLSTDAGQFAMIESVTPQDKSVTFEFVAAVPVEKDLRQYDNGIGPLNFESLRLISFPGGQQFGGKHPS
jgi:hypothetical protein